jgi:hypothetical protein
VRRLTAALCAGGLVLSLSACASDTDKYCSTLRSDQTQLGEMFSSTRSDALLQSLPLLRSLSAKAPDDLTDEWQTLVNAIAGLDSALHAAGLTAKDFQGSRVPDSVQGDERKNLIGAADRLTSSDTVQAAQGIDNQARDVCHVNLGL